MKDITNMEWRTGVDFKKIATRGRCESYKDTGCDGTTT